MIAKLKRCPWCNGHRLTSETTRVTHAIKCLECGAIGPSTTGSLANAGYLWNGHGVHQNPSAILSQGPHQYNNRDDLKEIEL